jgi:H+/gluconate symporter-like permease
MTPRRWIEYTIAILAGNALYFFVLYPGMAPVLQHQPFRFDLGLVVDFLCCVAVYGAIRLGVAHARRWSNGGRGVRSANRRPQRRSAPDR